jgi:hypothetical protein
LKKKMSHEKLSGAKQEETKVIMPKTPFQNADHPPCCSSNRRKQRVAYAHSCVCLFGCLLRYGAAMVDSVLNHVSVDADLETLALLAQRLGEHQLPHPVDPLVAAADGKVVSLAGAVDRFGRGRRG